MNRDLPEQFDYVIVGAGSAGCVLANRLSADPAIRVCLIEAGGADWYPWIHIPVGYFYTFDNPRTDWRFRTEPDAGLNGRSIKYPRGRVLGGTSSINGMVYIRGQAADYDGWRQQGNIGWSWNDVLPYFRKSEDQARGATKPMVSAGSCAWRICGPRGKSLMRFATRQSKPVFREPPISTAATMKVWDTFRSPKKMADA